jgi:hypothetical protein
MLRFAVLLSACALLSAGCGSSDHAAAPSRYRVSGKVTFNGQPVPAGTIYFETSQGPAGFAVISKGKFDTKKGKGVIGGPHKVLIEGFDGQGANPGEPGTPLFRPYRIQADLPQTDATQDYDVPASAADGLVIANDPA